MISEDELSIRMGNGIGLKRSKDYEAREWQSKDSNPVLTSPRECGGVCAGIHGSHKGFLCNIQIPCR